MLYNCIVIALALAIPVSAFLCFKIGYQTGRAVKHDGDLPKVMPYVKRERDRLTPEQERLNKLLQNIDAYDGTGEGQIKI